MNHFEKEFAQHLPNSFYGINPKGSFLEKIGYARNLLQMAETYLPTHISEQDIKALIVPHAGLQYSGLCAASAYQSILGQGKRVQKIKNVVVLSTRHSGKSGLLIPNLDHFIYNKTKYKIIDKFYTEFSTYDGITFDNSKEFLEEHSFEIQMPFIWNLFPGGKIKMLPILVGQLTQSQLFKIADLLSRLNTEDTLWIVSGDLMHVNGHFGYNIESNLTHELIRKESQMAINFIQPGKESCLSLINANKTKKHTICGIHALILWTAIAKNMKLIGKVSSYYTSLHTTNTTMIVKEKDDILPKVNIKELFHRFKNEISQRQSSVSYLGMIYLSKEKLNTYPLERRLTRYEKYAIYDFVKRITKHIIHTNPKNKLNEAYKTPPPFVSGSYLQKLAVFITFKNKGELRGCIGTTSNNTDMLSNVIKYTVEAGFNDSRPGLTRTLPIRLSEFKDGLTIDINLLDSPRLISDVIKKGKAIKPNDKILNRWDIDIDGIMLIDKHSNKSALFLPSVANEMGWNKEETLAHLSNKARLMAEDWQKPGVELYIIPGYEFGSKQMN